MTLDFVFRMCTGHDCTYWSERGELEWYNAYANPRDDSGKGILAANWNNFPHGARQWVKEQGYPDTINTGTKLVTNGTDSRSMHKFQDILERMGYQIEWSDQTTRCDHCYGCINTDSDYGDTAHYAILGESVTVCEDCIRKDFAQEYLESLEDNPRTACHIRGINPADYGYVRLSDPGEYESGFHPGQTDNLKSIYRQLQAEGLEHILFRISGSGQFDVHFETWVKAPTNAHIMDYLKSQLTDAENTYKDTEVSLPNPHAGKPYYEGCQYTQPETITNPLWLERYERVQALKDACTLVRFAEAR